jgi:putative addiction module killer protein
MNIIQKAERFEKWFLKLRDQVGKGKILARLKRAELGNLGDYKRIGSELLEMRIDSGPGYRVYFTKRGSVIILLLLGGDKSTQENDIVKAKQILFDLGGTND